MGKGSVSNLSKDTTLQTGLHILPELDIFSPALPTSPLLSGHEFSAEPDSALLRVDSVVVNGFRCVWPHIVAVFVVSLNEKQENK